MTKTKNTKKQNKTVAKVSPAPTLTEKVKDLEAQVRMYSALAEATDSQVDAFMASEARHEVTLMALYDSLMQERTDLTARVLRIDQRILALGFQVPTNRTNSESANLMQRRAGK